MTVTYAVEPFALFYAEARDLLYAHYLEVAVNQDIPLDPDTDFYHSAEKLGLLATYTARDDGKIVGYSLYFFRPRHPHYRVGWATNDIIYVTPECRRQGVANDLLEFAEAGLKKLGAAVVHTDAKTEHPELGRLLKSRKYRHTEDGYTKRL